MHSRLSSLFLVVWLVLMCFCVREDERDREAVAMKTDGQINEKMRSYGFIVAFLSNGLGGRSTLYSTRIHDLLTLDNK